METVLKILDKMIAEENAKLIALREELENADANNAAAQVSIAQKITQSVARLSCLQEFERRLTTEKD